MSDLATRALLVAQFRSTPITVDSLVEGATKSTSNGGMDITQRELASLANDADGLAAAEVNNLAAMPHFAYAGALQTPELAHDVALSALEPQRCAIGHACACARLAPMAPWPAMPKKSPKVSRTATTRF